MNRSNPAVAEEKYRMLKNSIDDGFCIIEVLFDGSEKACDYRFLEINPMFEAQTGLSNAEGKTVRELVPDLESSWIEIYEQVAVTGETKRFVNRAEALNRWFNVHAWRVGAEQERKVALLFKDVTTEVEAAREIEFLAKRNRGILESISDGFIALDNDWKFVYLNPAGEKIIGSTAESVIGKDFWEHFPGLRESEFGKLYLNATESKTSGAAEAFYPPFNALVQRSRLSARKRSDDIFSRCQREETGGNERRISRRHQPDFGKPH